MSQSDFHIENYQDVVYEDILDLHRRDGIAWSVLAEYAGYRGESSLKNIVQQRAHTLEFSRGLRLMYMAAKHHGNKRLHKHSFDASSEMIVPRPRLERAKGDIETETLEAMEAVSNALNASRNKDYRQLTKSYEALMRFCCRIREEVEAANSVIAKRREAEHA